MDSPVACQQSAERRQYRTASSPKEHCYGFCLRRLEHLSHLTNVVVCWRSFRRYIIRTPVIQPRYKEIGVTMLLFTTLNLLLGCNFYLAAQADLDIFSLSITAA